MAEDEKLRATAVVLALVLVASVPALAQLGSSEDSSYSYSYGVYSPETGEYIDCRVVNRDSAAYDVCVENGITPPVAYTVAPDGGIVSTLVGPPGLTSEEVDQEIRAQLQYAPQPVMCAPPAWIFDGGET